MLGPEHRISFPWETHNQGQPTWRQTLVRMTFLSESMSVSVS